MFSDSEEEFSTPEEITFEKSKEAVQKLAPITLKKPKKVVNISKKKEVVEKEKVQERPVAVSTKNLGSKKITATTLTSAELESIQKLKAATIPGANIRRQNCALQYMMAKIVKAKK